MSNVPETDVNILSHRFGFPLHSALLLAEFNIALSLLSAPRLNVHHVRSEDGNGALHLLFL